MANNDAVDVKVNATVEVTAVTADAGIKAQLDGSDFEGTVLQVRAEAEFYGVRYTDPEGVEHIVQGPGREWADATFQRFASTSSSPAVVRSRVLYLDWEAI